jgi:hypothetical protein
MTDLSLPNLWISFLGVKIDHRRIIYCGNHHIMFGDDMSKSCLAYVAFAHNHDTAFGFDLVSLIVSFFEVRIECIKLD